jgi:hypothetical protein
LPTTPAPATPAPATSAPATPVGFARATQLPSHTTVLSCGPGSCLPATTAASCLFLSVTSKGRPLLPVLLPSLLEGGTASQVLSWEAQGELQLWILGVPGSNYVLPWRSLWACDLTFLNLPFQLLKEG